MKLKCLLVDDEPPALKILKSYVENIDNLELVALCKNAFEAMKVLQEKQVDLMFLDIKMPKLLGTEFLRTLRNPPKVIFTTAYKDYALEGFDLDAVDYLLKPISLERFIKAITKLYDKSDLLPINKTENNTSFGTPFLYFRIERKMVKVMLDEILYIESLKDYVKIIRVKEKPLLVKQSISSLEDMLPENQFARIHRSFIIAINKVTAFTRQDVEINQVEIPIGRLYNHQISKFLKIV
ncbi:MAG: LytTR family DNA-binding domain-containing protein [Ginsengibacter sp.]|jgi:DNA-binding LytR/AlgR family response regulator